MTKDNQKILYDNFKRLSVEGTTDIQRERCAKYAAEILKSYPQFEKKVVKEVKTDSKEVKEKK